MATEILTPYDGCTADDITSPFGYRINPVTGLEELHDAIDFGKACGTPIRAVADGVVILKVYPNPNQDYGDDNYLWVDHGNGYVTRHNHLSRIDVNVGDHVTMGQTIGAIGSTGISTGCHLHFSIYENSTPIDPFPFLFNGVPLPIDGGTTHPSTSKGLNLIYWGRAKIY